MDKVFKKNFLSLAGIGFSKRAPGTLGSFLSLVVILVFKIFYTAHPVLIILTVLFVIAVFYFLAHGFITDLIKAGDFDQPWIVMDEFIGMLIAGLPFLVTATFNSWLLISGFILFRLLDVVKPWVIKKADLINSPHGVLLDDTIAGTLTALILTIIFFVF